MNVSLPESMRRYIDKQVREGGYGTSSEYVRELIRKDQAHQRLREALMEGIASGPAIEVNEEYWTAKLKRAANSQKVGAGGAALFKYLPLLFVR